MKIDGACYCGEIAYEAEIDPDKVFVCNCSDCQTMTGGTCHVNVLVEESDLTLLSGEPAKYIKTADSGKQRVMGFCGTCGSHLYATDVGDGPLTYGLRIPTSRQREQLVPKVQLWVRSRPRWLADPSAIPEKEMQ